MYGLFKIFVIKIKKFFFSALCAMITIFINTRYEFVTHIIIIYRTNRDTKYVELFKQIFLILWVNKITNQKKIKKN
jgi:hypothetical protein